MPNRLSLKFKDFAMKECRGSSRLYEILALRISEDQEILELASTARVGQPVPNLLFGAVHYLLLTGEKHPLNTYYPSMTVKPGKPEDAYEVFADFCRMYSKEIIQLLNSKIVQTNEVRRCAYLYPVFSYIYQKAGKPLALLEIGTSAGLQLFFDKYSYSYSSDKVFGNVNSPVHLTSEIRGNLSPLKQMSSPEVAIRIGMDLHINDVRNYDDYMWLKALIWPEHQERRELFEKAAQLVGSKEARLIEGDGVKLLNSLADEIPDEQVLCVFHTHVANQMPLETKEKLLKQIKEIGSSRDIFHIYNNIFDGKLHLDFYMEGKEYLTTIGETEGHGRWFTWELDY